MRILRVRQLALIAILLFVACQDEVIEENSIDEDMIAATALANDYLETVKGRFEDSDKAITVLKHKDGKLLFDTNTDDFKGYQEVVETSITAIVNPGDYIFWFAGGGLSEVDSIEFDEASEAYLGDLPEDFVPHKMWVIRVPLLTDQNQTSLKYDIVYVARENGIRVRLDPKITVGGQSDSGEEAVGEG
ncbi:hypothetical protein [Ekhidna sp.]|uniref:hypothetical protein n=1 Tax=Ekhidna sp. TaxID=2608089 RepID=UPI003B5B6E99